MMKFLTVKFEDVDYRIPSMRLLLEVGQVENTFTLEDFMAMEEYLLDFYEWKISHPTPIHFIDFYLHVSALGENYYSFDYKTFQQLAYQLLGLSLQGNHSYMGLTLLNTCFHYRYKLCLVQVIPSSSCSSFGSQSIIRNTSSLD